jgi:hypothetical protein
MEMFEESAEASTHADALAFLRAVYQCRTVPLPVRMKAASIAIEYERPRLAVTALVDGRDFRAKLERAIERSEGMKVIEHRKNGVEELDL